jgi:hypothetical protein
MAERKELKMVVECPTRWPSAYDMLDRDVYLQDAIIAFTSNQPEHAHRPANKPSVLGKLLGLVAPSRVQAAKGLLGRERAKHQADVAEVQANRAERQSDQAEPKRRLCSVCSAWNSLARE